VEVRALSFRYPTPAGPGAAPGPERVLDDVSFSAAPRSVTAVVGGRRAGKSTLAHLLQHLYEPAAGAVLLDGVDVRALDTDWLRENVTVVYEDPVLFNMSLAQNIAYAIDTASQAQVEAAARAAGAHDFIQTFPDGYQALVGDTGVRLTAGQKLQARPRCPLALCR
jgi:ABC-type multidrug transport system fused ATPase/permease subunit